MMIRMSSVMLFVGGIMLWMMSKAIPLLALMAMDLVGIFMMCGAMFILLFVFGISGVGLQYDSIPPGTAIVNFIRRDGIIVPLLGKRIFSGESFLDVPKVGLIEDLGKDTVFLWGRKKVRFGMENINYTPDPRFFNLTKELYKMGFDDSDDLYHVLNIPHIDMEKDGGKRKAYYLERMANIYWNMTHPKEKGAAKLVMSFKRKPDKKVNFEPKGYLNQRRAIRKAEPKVSLNEPIQKAAQTEPVRKDFDDEERMHKIIDERLK